MKYLLITFWIVCPILGLMLSAGAKMASEWLEIDDFPSNEEYLAELNEWRELA